MVEEISFCEMFLGIPPKEVAMSYGLKASEFVLRRWDRNTEKREVKLESDSMNRGLELAAVEALWNREISTVCSFGTLDTSVENRKFSLFTTLTTLS